MAKGIEKKEKKHFFKDFKAELKKVIWPTPKQVVNNTIAVITIVLITAVIVFALDLVFKAINTYGINGLRELVQKEDSENTTEEVVDTETTTEADAEAIEAEPTEETEVTDTESTETVEEQVETVEENEETSSQSIEE